MNGKLLRKARKICQLRAYDVQQGLGIKSSYLGEAERGRNIFDRATYARLWKYYLAKEKPPRFEGKHKTVSDLEAEFWNEF